MVAGEATQGKRLLGVKGSWAGSGTVTYAYQWFRCDQMGAHCALLRGVHEDELRARRERRRPHARPPGPRQGRARLDDSRLEPDRADRRRSAAARLDCPADRLGRSQAGKHPQGHCGHVEPGAGVVQLPVGSLQQAGTRVRADQAARPRRPTRWGPTTSDMRLWRSCRPASARPRRPSSASRPHRPSRGPASHRFPRACAAAGRKGGGRPAQLGAAARCRRRPARQAADRCRWIVVRDGRDQVRLPVVPLQHGRRALQVDPRRDEPRLHARGQGRGADDRLRRARDRQHRHDARVCEPRRAGRGAEGQARLDQPADGHRRAQGGPGARGLGRQLEPEPGDDRVPVAALQPERTPLQAAPRSDREHLRGHAPPTPATLCARSSTRGREPHPSPRSALRLPRSSPPRRQARRATRRPQRRGRASRGNSSRARPDTGQARARSATATSGTAATRRARTAARSTAPRGRPTRSVARDVGHTLGFAVHATDATGTLPPTRASSAPSREPASPSSRRRNRRSPASPGRGRRSRFPTAPGPGSPPPSPTRGNAATRTAVSAVRSPARRPPPTP